MERHTGIPRYQAAPATTARNPTPAESQRDYRRHGPHGRPGVPRLVWTSPPVNGRPVRFYTYRGNGPFAHEEW